MTAFTSVDKFIIDRLRIAEAVSLYELHVEFEFSPIQLQDSCVRLEELEFIELDRKVMIIRKIPAFFENLIKYRHAIYNRDPFWKRPNRSAFRKLKD